MQTYIDRRALFNPVHVRETALKMQRKVNFLSSLIDSANHRAEFEFPFVEQYMR